MDISMNSIDLMYLTNNFDLKKIKDKKLEPELLEDIKFYKERIIKQNIDLLNGKNIDESINSSYKRYLYLTIQHFKFIDKVDIIQKDYEGIKIKKNKKTNFNLEKTNNIITRKKETVGKITDAIDIKIKYKTKRKFIMPKKKIINLKDEHLKTKGLKKENITNIVDNVSKKKEN
tara:strand:+ start:2067 stop:2588 length:522 start_codon:yes stop_codon:yes gene_type:complete